MRNEENKFLVPKKLHSCTKSRNLLGHGNKTYTEKAIRILIPCQFPFRDQDFFLFAPGVSSLGIAISEFFKKVQLWDEQFIKS